MFKSQAIETGKYRIGWHSLYVQDNIKIMHRFIVTLAAHLTHAIRTSDFDSIPESQKNTKYDVVKPRLGVTWLFSPDISAYALYDQSFLPQVAQNFEQRPFEPLSGYNVETGIKSYLFNKTLRLDLSIFHIVKNHALTADPLHNGDFIQRGQIISKGIDIDMTGNITRLLLLMPTMNIADARITKDSDPKIVGLKNAGTPDHDLNLW